MKSSESAMWSVDDPLPRLRRVEVLPAGEDRGVRFFALQDPTRLAEQTLALSLPAVLIAAALDGARTAADVRLLLKHEGAGDLPLTEILRLIHALDDALFLDSPRARAADAQRRAAFAEAPTRDSRAEWPDERSLRLELKKTLAAAPESDWTGPIRGLIAPHLDYRRGAPCYAAAYAALRRAANFDALERVVILGTNHFGDCSAVVATGKDFLTPLGRVATDRAMLNRLDRRLGCALREQEFDHAREHSIELQVHLLQQVFGQRSFDIVPFLCPDPSGPTGTRPALNDGPDLNDFADALAHELAADDRPTLIMASADLSHVGQRFGESEPTDAAFLEQVGRTDRALLDLVASGAAEEFRAAVAATENATRICSVGCLYALLRLFRGAPCRTLGYHQAADFPAETHVTCAAAAIG